MSDRDPNKKKRTIFTPFNIGATLGASILAMQLMWADDNRAFDTDTSRADRDRIEQSERNTRTLPPQTNSGPFGPTGYEAPPQTYPQSSATELTYSEFLDALDRDQIDEVTIQETPRGTIIDGYFNNDERFNTFAPNDPAMIDRLRAAEVRFEVLPSDIGTTQRAGNDSGGGFGAFLGSMLPLILLLGVWIFFMNRMQGGSGPGNPLSGLGGNKAKLLTRNDNKVTFDDVAGIEEAKIELQETVDFLKNPMKYSRMGAKMPTGVLLVGPPGTGKTLTARAVAGEAGVPFFTISGSDFVEMFVGVGARRVRQMFEQAKKNAPCIVFIDEIDAVGRSRGQGHGGGNDEREQTLNQLLVEMDGFEKNNGVVLIAATNRPDVLDAALLRPGRFDRQVVVPTPDLLGREKILQVHMRGKAIGPDVDVRAIANGTPGFSGADLANLVNEMVILAARGGKKYATMEEFNEAWLKVQVGYKRSSLVMDREEITRTAYHEIGHALVGIKTDPQCDPVHHISVVPRGQALGVTVNLPTKDQVGFSEAQLRSKLAMMFGGRKAEELIYGKKNITTGAANDIQQATNIATKMVMEWGFSDKVGRRRLVSNQQQVFLGQGGSQALSISPDMQKIVDEEIQAILDEAERTAENIIKDNMDDFELLTKTLMKYETLSGKEMDYILEHQTDTLPERDMELAAAAERKAANDHSPFPQTPDETEIIPPKPEAPKP